MWCHASDFRSVYLCNYTEKEQLALNIELCVLYAIYINMYLNKLHTLWKRDSA